MADCTTCVGTSKNSGTAFDSEPFGAVNGTYFWAVKAADGTFNEIDLNATLDQAFWDALINHVDPTKRIYPVHGVEDPASEAPERFDQTFTSGRRRFLGQGARTWDLLIPGTTTKYFGQLKAQGCGRLGVLYRDECLKIKGNHKVNPGFLRPIEVGKDTYSALLSMAVDAGNDQQTNIVFDHLKTELDENHGYITDESYTFDPLTEGLTDISIIDLAVTASDDTLTFKVETNCGDVSNLSGVPGLQTTDFVVTVNAIGTTLATITDLGNGLYSATTTADILVTEVVVLTVAKDGLSTATASVIAAA